TTLLGGGRYNGLTEQLGGPESPGIGFGMGLERLMMALESEEIPLPIDDSIDVYFIALGDDAQLETVKLMQSLRQKGLKVEKDEGTIKKCQSITSPSSRHYWGK